MPILKAAGPSVAVIHFDASKTAGLRTDEIYHLAYHVAAPPYAPVGGGMAVGNYVGGAVQMAPISESGVEAVQLREWPDQVGKPIAPM